MLAANEKTSLNMNHVRTNATESHVFHVGQREPPNNNNNNNNLAVNLGYNYTRQCTLMDVPTWNGFSDPINHQIDARVEPIQTSRLVCRGLALQEPT